MQVHSKSSGLGATFRFTVAVPLAESVKGDRRELIGPQPALENRRVLVVDDNTSNRKVLALHSTRWGMAVRDIASAAEALRWLDEDAAFDLAILAMHMPEMDGLALVAQFNRLN